MTETTRYATQPGEGGIYPWNTGPSGQGSATCAWCDREIYRPVVPCSESPIAGLADIVTGPGMGDRCKYELSTRSGLSR